jgi:hypothetical protein
MWNANIIKITLLISRTELHCIFKIKVADQLIRNNFHSFRQMSKFDFLFGK